MRLITRADLDGLTCAVLITEIEPVESIELIHPQDLTDKRFQVLPGDIMANVPYDPNAGKWFDHHLLTSSNPKPPEKFSGAYRHAPSTARIVYEYYNDSKLKKYDSLVYETDRMDSANLTLEDVLDPKGFILLGYTIDPRTGLTGFKDYFMLLLDALKTKNEDQVLELPEVKKRVNQMREEWVEFKRLTQEHSRMEGNVVVTDFRDLEKIPVGNRFIVYTLFPQSNVSIRLHWGPRKEFVAVVVGHSIFNRTCKVNVGELMSEFGGGGHVGAGATPLKLETAEQDLQKLIKRLQS